MNPTGETIHPVAPAATRTATLARTEWADWMLPAFALACWLLAIRHLAPSWMQNEQYQFGWLVPFLAAYLLKVRFEQLPPRGPQPGPFSVAAATLALAVVAVLIMPIREANLDWRLVEWSLAAVAIAATLLCAWQAGGTRWIRHFAFPVFFFLIAVPLPRNLEYPWMDRLMLNNAHASVEVLHWLGVEAVARGNLIELPTGILGVDEACSGIRSLQSTCMLSLFLGEILPLPWLRRLLLLGAGFGWALLTNIVRTSLLGLAAARDGLPAVDRWHDLAGYSVLAGCALAVAATAWLLHRFPAVPSPREPAAPPASLATFSACFRPAALPAALALGLLLLGLGGTRLWFDFKERTLTRVADWEFAMPTDQPAYRDLTIPPRTRKTLGYSDGYSGLWKDDSGRPWQAYFFRWERGQNSSQAAAPHDPRSCLGGIGMELAAVLPSVPFTARDVSLSFDAFHFRDRGRDLYVFNCLAEDMQTREGGSRLRQTNSPAERLAAAFAGSRQSGQRRVEVAVWDAPSAEAATARFRALLQSQIRLAGEPPRH